MKKQFAALIFALLPAFASAAALEVPLDKVDIDLRAVLHGGLVAQVDIHFIQRNFQSSGRGKSRQMIGARDLRHASERWHLSCSSEALKAVRSQLSLG